MEKYYMDRKQWGNTENNITLIMLKISFKSHVFNFNCFGETAQTRWEQWVQTIFFNLFVSAVWAHKIR